MDAKARVVWGLCLVGSAVACTSGAQPPLEPAVETDSNATTGEGGDSEGGGPATGTGGSSGGDDPRPPEGSSSGGVAGTTGEVSESGSTTGGVVDDCPRVQVEVAPGATLNVRSGPSTADDPIGSLYNYELVDMLEEVVGESLDGNDVWYRVASPDLEGFVSSTYATCTMDDACPLVDPPEADYLAYGLHPDASDALVAIGVTAGRIMQTIGDAAASAGTHGQDGTRETEPYSCALDLSVSGMSEVEIHQLLDDLASVGYAGWYRDPGADGVPTDWVPHIHTVWVGAPMKLSLRDQVRSWMDGRNGLVSDTPYQFHQWAYCRRDAVWARYLEYNPANG